MKALNQVKIHQLCYIHPTASIGENTKIGAFCDIGKKVVIGRECNIQAHVTISNECVIGAFVFIGPNTSLLNDKYMDGQITRVLVERHAKIGGGCVILPGVKIGRYAIIGAGSVVTKNVGPATTVYGNPAKKHKKRGR